MPLFQNRQKVFGANRTPEVRMKTLMELIWDAAKNPILFILAIAAAISLVLGLGVEGNVDTGGMQSSHCFELC